MLSFVEGVNADELAREIRMPWAAFFEQQSKQPAGVHTLGESVLQVFLHTQHHRGQVCSGCVRPAAYRRRWISSCGCGREGRRRR